MSTRQPARILLIEDAVQKSSHSDLTVRIPLVRNLIQMYPSLQRRYTPELRTASQIFICQPEFVASMEIS
jgi:hypothetical protein